jgi:hypothetical protein
MDETADHETYWTLRLFVILQEMAAERTNAVLELVGNVDHLESEHSYPETSLFFAADRWRAFYHCHESTSLHPDEHGHFHIFTDTGDQGWAHVAGLSIDNMGQPLQWFAVNRWVTDGPWLEQDKFSVHLNDAAHDDEEDKLVGRWLLALLQVYRDALSALLINRDEQIQLFSKERSRVETLDDRDIYTLATHPIDLQSMLENHLPPLLNEEKLACTGI